MKRCPMCQKVYTQTGISFCLDDGATLVETTLAGDETIISTQALPPGRKTEPTMPPPLMGIIARPDLSANHAPVSTVPPTVKAGRGLGSLALLCGVASFLLMILGFVFITAEISETMESVGAGLLILTFGTGLLGAILGLLGIFRAVRNDNSKVLPLVGFALNVVYLVLILSLLLLGAVVSLGENKT